jgi:predicted SnoaL-like aldol condensation-catalyzing enzyme
MPELIALSAHEIAGSGRSRTATETANVATILAGYDALVGGGESDEVDALYSPTVPSGDLAGLKAFIAGFHAAFPQSTIQVKRVLADGDFVIVHTWGRRTPDQKWDEVMEIFRTEDGLIAEHWEVIEPWDLMRTPADAAN